MWCSVLIVVSVVVARAASVPTDLVNNENNVNNLKNQLHTPTTTFRITSANDVDSSKSELLANNTSLSVHQRFPHAVLFSQTCGGSIISPKWILTAGHCTLFQKGRYVLAGTSVSDDGSGVYRAIKRRVIHPLFTVGPYWLNSHTFGIKQVMAKYDFLLAELEEPFPIDGKNIAVIPLGEEMEYPGGDDVGFAGYGAEHHGETMRHTMHAMDLETVADETCARRFMEFDRRDMVCTKGRPPRFDSACNGDSGSGIVRQGKLIGIASWVEDDAITCRPGTILVCSRVAAVRDWIRQVTGI